MRIYIASDHAGFELKKKLVEFLKIEGHQVEDLGPFQLNPDDDYPDFVYPLSQKVISDTGSVGIVIGGSGQGEAMIANKVKGARAAVYYSGDLNTVKFSRTDNDANILSLGARFVNLEGAKKAVKLFLSTKFSGEERHKRRIEKISKLEK